MKPLRTFIIAALLSILTPGALLAQFEALRVVDLPAVGAWAEYLVTRRNESQRIVMSQRVSFLGRQLLEDGEHYWFQIEMESDDYGPKRVPIVTQIALRREDALSRRDYFRKIGEMLVQVRTGDAPIFRIGRASLAVGVDRNLLTGGERGAGTDVEYALRDLEPESVRTPAGEFLCEHRKGIGKAEVVLSPEDGGRYPVDAILELWTSTSVPFGLVKQVAQQKGAGPQTEGLSLTIDTEETTELVACGAGAASALLGPIVDYDPALASRLAGGRN